VDPLDLGAAIGSAFPVNESPVNKSAPAERRFLLFVYGTLLSGEPSHGLLNGARSLGAAKTPPSFELVDLGPHPALVAGGSTAVTGELYEVPVAMLAALDVHEEVPVLFKRATIVLADGRAAEAYLLEADQVRGRRRIGSGDWRARFRRKPAPSARDSAFVRWSRTRAR
jgi:gamma-glutamylcyclotransferase (GGCT)/AIG2-like uncharacterized protein YtfP